MCNVDERCLAAKYEDFIFRLHDTVRIRAMRALDFQGDLNAFLRDYRYQPELRKTLDQLGDRQFNQELVNEIVLWKLNRYVALSNSALQALETLRALRTGEHRQGEAVLRSLLASHGVDLPMASTILRFRNVEAFQIIDRHAYRAFMTVTIRFIRQLLLSGK